MKAEDVLIHYEELHFSLAAAKRLEAIQKKDPSYTRETLERELRIYFGVGPEHDGFGPSTLSRILTLGEKIRKGVKPKKVNISIRMVKALDEILEMGFAEWSDGQQVVAECAQRCDPEYEARDLRRVRHPDISHVWTDRLQRYAASINLPVTIKIPPTRAYSDRDDKLGVLGAWGAIELERKISHDVLFSVLVGLGKHVRSAVVKATHDLPSHHTKINWFPSMRTYEDQRYFNANTMCAALAGHFGGYCPIELDSGAFVPVDVEHDRLLESYESKSHRELFGALDANVSATLDINDNAFGLVDSCDTAILGSGVCAQGNPLWDSPGRQRDSANLRKGDYPVVGDINGHYLVVNRAGQPSMLSESICREDSRNVEAWDANRRAMGARPSMYQRIAKKARKSTSANRGGVILLANAAARAPLVYAVLHLGLANTIVMDYECAKMLVSLLREPWTVCDAVPRIVDW